MTTDSNPATIASGQASSSTVDAEKGATVVLKPSVLKCTKTATITRACAGCGAPAFKPNGDGVQVSVGENCPTCDIPFVVEGPFIVAEWEEPAPA